MLLIGIAGKKGSGKTETSKSIQQLFPHCTVRIVSFATPLKECIQKLFNLDSKYLFGSFVEKETIIPDWNVSGRQLMQIIGTDIIRNQFKELFPMLPDNIFIHSMRLKLESITEDIIICDDVRFKDECDFIHKMGGIIIYVSSKQDNGNYDDHESENDIIEYDEHVYAGDFTDKLYEKHNKNVFERIQKLK